MAEPDVQFSAEVINELLSTELFIDVDGQALEELKTVLELTELPEGSVLFRAGDPGDFMAFVMRGMLEVCIAQPEGNSLRLDVLEPGSTAGETALLTGQPRSALVSAMVDSQVVRLPREGFIRLLQKYPEAMETFSHQLLPRIQRTQLAAVLMRLFGPIDFLALNTIRRMIAWRRLTAGEILMRKGDVGNAMYIVINGRLRIVDDDTGEGNEIGEAESGEMVGEFALLTGEPRSATVVALRDSDVVCLTRDHMDRLIEAYPSLLLQITRSIVRRRQSQLQKRPSTAPASLVLAVLPGSSDLPMADFIDHLTAGLSAAGRILAIDSRQVEEKFGRRGAAQLSPDHPSSALFNSWLSGMETACRYLVLVADSASSEWTRRCIRQADRLVVVATADGEPSPELSAQSLQPAWGEKIPDLVVLHPKTTLRPVGASRWLGVSSPDRLHHVRLDNPGDFRRLARRLSGRSLGLVLSGGGARGFSHIGAIRAMEEAGLEIDLIGGTSMGALIGAAYAMDWDSARMLEMARTFALPGKLLDYTLPYTSLVSSYKVSKILHDTFGDVRIEDLWRSYFCLSTNLSRAEPVIHQSGELWQAVRASIAIPGIFAPLLHEGDLLVDGGVMNNFPVDIMRKRCEGGKVIGVNASPKKEKVREYQFDAGVSGWQVLWSKINPLAPRIRAPSILSSLMRATETNSIYRNAFLQQLVDVLIQPQVSEYSSLAFGEYEPIIEQGYQAAKASLAAL